MTVNHKSSSTLVRTILRVLVCIIFLFSGYTAVFAQQNHSKRILCLASYDLSWPATASLLQGFKDATAPDTEFHYVFMDTKVLGVATAERITYERLKTQLPRETSYDGIYVCDDDALNFALKYQSEFFKDLPIVFSGINDLDKAAKATRDPKITGETEALPIQANLDLACKLLPKATRILAITDGTISGQSFTAQLMSQRKNYPDLEFSLLNCSEYTEDEILHTIHGIGGDTIVVFLSFNEDKTGHVYTFPEAVQLLSQNSSAPLFRFDEAGIGQGLLGGIVISFYDMGKDCGYLMHKALIHPTMEPTPALSSSTRALFDKDVLDKYKLSETMLPKNTELLHKPDSFFMRNSNILIPALIVVSVLTVLLILLLWDNKCHRQRITILRRHDEEIRQAHRKLQESETAFSIAIEHAGMFCWEYYPNEDYALQLSSSRICPNLPDRIDHFPEPIVAAGLLKPESAAVVRRLQQRLLNGDISADADIQLHQSDNQCRWLHIRYTSIPDEDGHCIKAIGSGIDITEQKQIEARYEEENVRRHAIEKDIIETCSFNITENRLIDRCLNGRTIDCSNEKITLQTFLEKKLYTIPLQEDRDFLCDHLTPEYCKQMYQTGQHTLEYQFKKALGGHHLWYLLQTILIEHPTTHDLILITYIHDIDEAKKNQLAVRSVLDEEIDLVSCLDLHTGLARIVKDSKYISELGISYNVKFNYEEELIKSAHGVVSDQSKGKFIQCYSIHNIRNTLANPEGQYILDFWYKTPAKEKRRKMLRAFYLNDEKDTIVFVQRDVTKMYLKGEQQRLQLEHALEVVKNANQAKTDFLSRMSHEIRTPMSAIIGLTSLCLTKITDTEYVKSSLEKMDASAHFLLGLINDILDISRIESGKMQLNINTHDMAGFISEINTIISARTNEKEQHYEVSLDPAACGNYRFDDLKLKQVLVNILSNAVKFTSQQGTIYFSIRKSNLSDDISRFQFTITDTGIGIDEKFLPKIFDAFEQEYSGNTTLYGGTGLGLAISNNIIMMMKGTIDVSSKKGNGSTFTVTVDLENNTAPYDSTHTTPPIDKDTNIYDFHGYRVLLAEDNEINRDIATSLLKMKGFSVDAVENGEMAVSKFTHSPSGYYDIILMDIRMPIMDGLTATAKIRSSGTVDCTTIPILAMTANAFEEDIRKSLQAGMNAHLTKPIEPRIFYITLHRFLTK